LFSLDLPLWGVAMAMGGGSLVAALTLLHWRKRQANPPLAEAGARAHS
jgi:hypothetical protein